jgi:acetylornithine aminotransferase
VYARPNIILSHGEGLWVWDNEGRKYLDFSAGIAVNALGHGDEGMLSVSRLVLRRNVLDEISVQVLTTEAKKLIHTSNVYHNEWAGKLAELLVTLTQREGGLGFPAGTHAPPSEQPGADAAAPAGGSGAKVFFANTGAEANEGALKVARKVGKDRGGAGKAGLVCFANAFHGRTMGALSVTANAKYQQPFAPLLPGVRVGELNDHGGLHGLVDESTCAVIVEPIQGEGGCTAADVDWLRALRKRCDETGAVLIYDEVQVGASRPRCTATY